MPRRPPRLRRARARRATYLIPDGKPCAPPTLAPYSSAAPAWRRDVDHRHHRAGRLVPGRAAAREGLRGPRHRPPVELVQPQRIDHLYHDPHDGDAVILHYGDLTDASSINRILRDDPARRDLQPRRAEPRAGQLRRAGVHRRVDRRSATLRLLEAIREVGARRRGSTRPARREMFGKVAETPQTETTPFYPRSPVRRGQGVRVLDHGELPRGVRHVRLQRHPVQSRVAAARRERS